MAKLVCLSRSIHHDFPFAVHAEGCSDIERTEVRKYQAVRIGTADTEDEAVATILDGELGEMGYEDTDVKFFPCTDHWGSRCS